MPTVHHTKLTPSAWVATSAQPGYGAENLASEALARPWWATSTGANDLTATFLDATGVQVLLLHDVNFATATIQKSVDGVAFVDVGVLTTYPDDNGRRRGALVLAAAGVKAVRIRIANGAATDGLAYWRAGAPYLFGASTPLPVGPRIGYSVTTRRALVSAELPNNQVAIARTGFDADVIELAFERKFDQSLGALVEKAKAGTVGFSMDLPDWPAQLWPVRYIERESAENFFRVHKAQRQVRLREVV